MINLQKYIGPYGIPVYHQQIPNTKVTSLGWLIMTGAADDESVGSPGLYHWFEHVPFRGTRRFPRGTADIIVPFTRLNGWINAWTNKDMTSYYATVHESQWKDALARVTDMVSCPLLRSKDVDAERKIIHQEISQSYGSINRCAWRKLAPILYPGHPYAHDVLGSEETLASMDSATLVRAHELGYDRSRAVFVSVGPMTIEVVLKELESVADCLPNRQLSERRTPAYFGPTTGWNSGTFEVESTFGTTVVKILFPMASNRGEPEAMLEAADACALLDSVFSYGDTASPLMRIVREERQLVYGIQTSYDVYPGGSHFGFTAMSQHDKVPAIIEAVYDVLKAQELMSEDRLGEMKTCLTAELEMMPIDPTEFRDRGISQLQKFGTTLNYMEVIERFNRFSVDDVVRLMKIFDPEKALVFVYKGMGTD